MKLKVAYFGTPSFSADLLEKLILSKLVDVSLVVTQPDKPVGREQTLTPSPVKLIAQKYRIEVFDHNELSELPELLIIKNVDFSIVFSYGKILKQDVLASPKIKFPQTNFSFINIHPSLLPKYRGASPIVFPLLLGDKETGVSLILMDELMDHGPIIAQEKLSIENSDTTQTLITKGTTLAFYLLSSLIQQLKIKNLKFKINEQFHARATFTRTLTRDDGFIPLSLIQKALNGEATNSSELPEIIKWYYGKNNLPLPPISNIQYQISLMHRSLSPWPGLWTTIEIDGTSKRLILKRIATSDKRLTIQTVQLEGKTEVDFETFNKAYKIF